MVKKAVLLKQRKRVAARVAHAGAPAGKAPRLEMRHALIRREACEENLSTPDGAIEHRFAEGTFGVRSRPRPRAVKSDTDNTCSGIDLSVHGGLRDDGGDVRMMVLHADEWKAQCPCLLLRPLAGEVSRVGIAGEYGGAHIKELRHAIERRFPRIERLRIFKVADMLGNEALFRIVAAGAGERKGRLLLGAACQMQDEREAGGTGSAIGRGAKPRARRTSWTLPLTTRTTESSNRERIARSLPSKASANPLTTRRFHARPSSISMGSSLTFPLVITSASTPRVRHSSMSRCWSGV